MAAITPVSANKCVGTFTDGSPNIQLYCQKALDDQGDPIYSCATWKLFRQNCPKINQKCSNRSEAWVAASTVCNQRLL